MEDSKLIAKKRDLQGSANSRRLRKAGNLPGVIYGDGKEATPILLNMHDFEQLLHHHTSETVLVDIAIEGEGEISALVKDVQHHPVTGDLVHVDLQKMDAKKVIQVEIQVELVGEANGVKAGGILDLVMHTISIECLPGDLSESIEIDVSEMEIGDALHLGDLELDSKFKVLGDKESIVVSVSEPHVETEEDEDEAGAANAEPEVISEKKADEGSE
jgi:large subunit ribosomal protein L25